MAETNTPLVQTNFAKSLDQLNRRVDWVPHGWQALYVDLRRRLIGVQSVQRAHIHIEGPWLGMYALYFEVKGEDKVVRGILRKALRTSCHVCRDCGRPGKSWEIQDRDMVLCSHCVGLRLLRADLESLSKYMQRHARHASSGWLRIARLSPRTVALLKVAQPDAIERGPKQTWHVHLEVTQQLVLKAMASLDQRLD